MNQDAILREARGGRIRVKGLRRFFARFAGWLHALKKVITAKEDKLQSPFFSAAMAHYEAFAAKDCARIEELLSEHKKRYAALTRQLDSLRCPVPEETSSSPEVNAYRHQQAVAQRESQIRQVKVELETLAEMISQCDRIYGDRCAHARGMVEARISAYRSGAARLLKKQGIDCNAELEVEFPETRSLMVVFKKAKEDDAA